MSEWIKVWVIKDAAVSALTTHKHNTIALTPLPPPPLKMVQFCQRVAGLHHGSPGSVLVLFPFDLQSQKFLALI